MRNFRKFIGIGIVLIAVLTVAASWAFANNETPTTYYACVNNSSGTIKVWTEPTDCNSNEFPIQWNNVGPKGDKGDPGPQGPPGPSAVSEAFATGNGDISLSLDNAVDVMTLDLPTGEYISNVTLAAAHQGEGHSFMDCHYDYVGSEGRYTLPGQSWQSGTFGGAIPSDVVTHAHTHAITLEEATEVIVVCEVIFQEPTGPTVTVHHAEWNVIKVDTLNIQAQDN